MLRHGACERDVATWVAASLLRVRSGRFEMRHGDALRALGTRTGPGDACAPQGPVRSKRQECGLSRSVKRL
ncbi:hypothetical protein HMPREF1503_0792 [Olsenella uli MSTE5]|nr:hypothetical protein HMPREF1503_0792 [Olsenella uli MSTE5]